MCVANKVQKCHSEVGKVLQIMCRTDVLWVAKMLQIVCRMCNLRVSKVFKVMSRMGCQDCKVLQKCVELIGLGGEGIANHFSDWWPGGCSLGLHCKCCK